MFNVVKFDELKFVKIISIFYYIFPMSLFVMSEIKANQFIAQEMPQNQMYRPMQGQNYGQNLYMMNQNSMYNNQGNTNNMNISPNMPHSMSQSMVNQMSTNVNGTRTCDQAIQESNGQAGLLDLSNTTDFAVNGYNKIMQFYEQSKQAGIDVLYIDLCNTEVPVTILQDLSAKFKNDNIKILWNLSDNNSVDDAVLQALGSFNNIIGLNISNTKVTDIGLQTLVNMQSQLQDSSMLFINIYGTQVQPMTVQTLKAKFNEIVMKWQANHPNEARSSFSMGIIQDLGISNNSNSNTNLTNNQTNNIMNDNNMLLTQIPNNTTMTINNVQNNSPNNIDFQSNKMNQPILQNHLQNQTTKANSYTTMNSMITDKSLVG